MIDLCNLEFNSCQNKLSMCLMIHQRLQQVLRRDIFATTSKILLRLFYILLSYVSLRDYKVRILKFYIVPVRLNGVTTYIN